MTAVQRALVVLLPALLAALLFANTMSNEFVLDDIPAVVENPGARAPIDPVFILTTNYWGNRHDYEHLTIYRPLATLSFAVGHALHGPAPAGYHGMNALIHGLVTAIVAALALALFGRLLPAAGKPWRLLAAAAAALLFAVHPVHTEAVAGVVNRAELLSALFVCAFLLVAVKVRTSREEGRRPFLLSGLATLLFALALLSKENAATALVMLPLMDLALGIAARRDAVPEPRRLFACWPLLAACAVVLVLYLGLRALVLPATFGGAIPASDNPIVTTTGVIRALSPFIVYLKTLHLLFAPHGLSVDYTAHAIPLASGPGDPMALLGVAAFLGTVTLGVLWARRRPDAAFSVALFLAAYSVVSHMAFPATVIFAERLLYLPSVGFCLLGGLGFAEVFQRSGRGAPRAVVVALGLLVLAAGAGITLIRNTEWRDEATLYAHSLLRTPGSSRLWNNHGRQLALAEDFPRARNAYERAVAIDPGNFAAWSNIASSSVRLGDLDRANEAVERALRLKPNFFYALHTLCILRMMEGNFAGATFPCSRAAEIVPGDLGTRVNLVHALIGAGEQEAALEAVAAIEADFPRSREAGKFTTAIRRAARAGDL